MIGTKEARCARRDLRHSAGTDTTSEATGHDQPRRRFGGVPFVLRGGGGTPSTPTVHRPLAPFERSANQPLFPPTRNKHGVAA